MTVPVHPFRSAALAVAMFLVPASGATPAWADTSSAAGAAKSIPHTKADFTDAEIADGFFHVAFGAEYRLAGPSDRIRKYVAPVRVAITGTANPARRSELERIIADISRKVRHLDIALATPPEPANVTVTLVPDRDLERTIIKRFGKTHGASIQGELDPQCLSGFRRNARFEIERAEVLLAVDADAFTFRDCAYEELLQALGPINDTDAVPWTMFNDGVRLGYFGLYDQYLLNILYDPRITPGMTPDQVRRLLPDILPDVRAFVARSNHLPPPR